jgi:hypothetical protein
VRKRYFFYCWLVLLIGGLFAYATWFAQIPVAPQVNGNSVSAHAKLDSFNREVQAAYTQTQMTGRVGHVSLSLTDADASALLSEKEGISKLDKWTVHFEANNQVQVWATSSRLNGALHHNYQIYLLYHLDSFDNRAAAELVGVNMTGFSLPTAMVAQIEVQVASPLVEFPLGFQVATSSRAGEMLLEVTT